MITRSTLPGMLIDSIVWGLDKELAAKWINDALVPILEDFKGSLPGDLSRAEARRDLLWMLLHS